MSSSHALQHVLTVFRFEQLIALFARKERCGALESEQTGTGICFLAWEPIKFTNCR